MSKAWKYAKKGALWGAVVGGIIGGVTMAIPAAVEALSGVGLLLVPETILGGIAMGAANGAILGGLGGATIGAFKKSDPPVIDGGDGKVGRSAGPQQGVDYGQGQEMAGTKYRDIVDQSRQAQAAQR